MAKLENLLVGIAVFFYGCISSSPRIIPCYNEFKRISQEEYVLNQNDCSNKAGEYVEILRRKGYRADAIVIYQSGEKYSHAIVRLHFNGRDHYLDPTQRKAGRNLHKIYPNIVSIKEVSDSELESQEWRRIIKPEDSDVTKK